MNEYLKRKREQYETLRAAIEQFQTTAQTENRDLTETELGEIRAKAEQAKTVHAEIESLTEQETRNRSVSDLAASLGNPDPADGEGATGDQTRSASSTSAVDRDPGHYTRGSHNSFFADMHRSRQGDETAGRRLAEHNRALSPGTEGAGVVPPKWLTEEFETLARQGRRVAGAVRNIPLGDDPRPLTLPRQSAGTSDVVAEQGSENESVSSTDAWESDTTTVTPRPTAGSQIVSRQMLDMSDPAIDMLIYGDLMSVYNERVEAKVINAMVSSAGSAVTTYADQAEFDDLDAEGKSDLIVDLAIAVRNARKRAADIFALSISNYGEFLKTKDTTGRPLIPMDSAGPRNVIGVGSVETDGIFHGMSVFATDALGSGYPDNILAARASDTVLFESGVMRFRYEEPNGPESIKMGIWGYTAVHVKYDGQSVKRAEITDETAA